MTTCRSADGTNGRAANAPARRTVLSAVRASADLRLAVAALYVLLVALVGFSHIAPAGAAPSTPAALAWLPDGTASDICTRWPVGKPASDSARPTLCDGCLIVSAPGLPVVESVAMRLPAGVVRVDIVAVVVRLSGTGSGAVRARGPPAATVV